MESEENPLVNLASCACAQSMEGNSHSSSSSNDSFSSSSSASVSSSSSSSNDSSNDSSTPTVLESPDAKGYLRLKENPRTWIRNSTPASHLLVKHLELDFSGIMDDNIWDSREKEEIEGTIDHLTQLTRLTICGAKSLKSIPNSMSSLHSLHYLKFYNCYFQELPANLEVLNISLTHLTLDQCRSIKSFPESIATLSNLTSLHLNACDSLAELPPTLGSLRHLSLESYHKMQSLLDSMPNLPNLETLYIKGYFSVTEVPSTLGQLGSLKHFSLEGCYNLRFLPHTMSSLLNLETLYIKSCNSLIELPPSLESLKHLSLENCTSLKSLANLLNFEKLHVQSCRSITELPRGLIKLRHLVISPDLCSECLAASLKDSVNLEILNVVSNYPLIDIPIYIANFLQFSNLKILSFRSRDSEFIIQFPDTFEGLDQLILLDIQDTEVKYLPWSIMKLPKLQFLMLPWAFRLETLPFCLDDSILISVKGRCIRKIWNQLKQEIGISPFPFGQGDYPSIIAPPGYLSLKGDLGQCFSKNYESRCLVKMLELELLGHFDAEGIKSFIGELPNLTHLFVTYGNGCVKNCLPRTIKGLKHLCLKWCDSYSRSVSLLRLSNLHTLDLIVKKFPSNLNLPVNLRHLSIHSQGSPSLSESMAKLSNLHTFELFVNNMYAITSLPPLNIVTLRINRIINSLPTSLRHLEILHNERDCFDKRCDGIRLCLSQLVNLEILSLTCYHMKSLPSMARLSNLQVLLLKDCFTLKKLKPDIKQLVELRTLDISGTRIKYLPDCIINMPKLQQLILPRCFQQK